MENLPHWLTAIFAWLTLPEWGLSTLFVLTTLSATLLPLSSEPAVLGLIKLNSELFWPAIAVATAGNTLGGAINWWLGYGMHRALEKYRRPMHEQALQWLKQLGPKACLLSWLPLAGDPLCVLAGWLRLPFWPCLAYMLMGKFLRYLCIAALVLKIMPDSLSVF
jgi:membrane protein YqaA with SNARE-associated domain